MAADLDPASRAALGALLDRLEQARPTNIGFPGALDFDYSELAPLFAQHLLNNVGDPYTDGVAANHTKSFEREVVGFVAGLLRAPGQACWGYVTSGASEGTLYALHLARGLHPTGMVYVSQTAHYSVHKAIDLLAMRSITIRADRTGEMDYHDLAAHASRYPDRPAIVVANIGTTMTEAVDDIRRIKRVLNAAKVRHRFIHADAALAGLPLALLPPAKRPGFDFEDGADSVIVSGHKFIGSPMPSGVVVVKANHRLRVAESVAYTGSPDTTISGSRNGHTALMLWYALRRHGISGLRRRAEQSRTMAAYTLRRLSKIGWPAYRNPHAFTVVLRTPPPAVTARWVLASSHGWSHIVCMPGVTRDQIDEFVEDLHAATTLTRRTLEERRRSARRRASAPARPGERESA